MSITQRCSKEPYASKRPPPTPRRKVLRLECAKNNMKTDMTMMKQQLSTPLSFRHCRFRRQQGGGGIMIWAGIVGDALIEPFRVHDRVEITSASYCQLLESNLLTWLGDEPLQKNKTFIFQHDNAPAQTHHSGSAVSVWWPPCSPDLNSIENLWAILKRDINKDGKQFTSKVVKWKSIQVLVNNLTRYEIQKLTESLYKRIVKEIQRNRSFVNY